jgi:hypothetical protein
MTQKVRRSFWFQVNFCTFFLYLIGVSINLPEYPSGPDNHERHPYTDTQLKILRETGNSKILEIPKNQPALIKFEVTENNGKLDQQKIEPEKRKLDPQIESTPENSTKRFKDFLECRQETSNYLEDLFHDPLLPEDPNRDPEGTILIKNFKLNTKENLRFLIDLEEKTLIPSYQKNQTFTPSERGTLARLIMKTVLKPKVDRL